MNDEFADEGLHILAVDISNDVVRTRAFYEEFGFTLPAGFDVQGTVSRQFGIEATPTNYLIDANGQVVWRGVGFRPGDQAKIREEIVAVLGAS